MAYEPVITLPGQKPLGGEPLAIDELFEGEIEQPRWAIGGMIEEQDIVIISGESYTGKTYLLMDLAIQFNLAGRWLNCFEIANRYNVLYFDKEMSRGRLKRRFQRIARGLPPDTERPYGLTIYPYGAIRMDGRMPPQELVDVIKRNNINWIMVDSLRKFISGDENDSSTADRFHDSANMLRSETGCGIVVIHHWNKEANQEGRKVRARARGSGAWIDMCDTHLGVALGPQPDTLQIKPDKVREGMKPEGFLVRFAKHGPGPLDPFHMEVVSAELRNGDMSAQDKVWELVRRATPDSPADAPTIAATAGLGIRSTKYALRDLVQSGRADCQRSPGGRGERTLYWPRKG